MSIAIALLAGLGLGAGLVWLAVRAALAERRIQQDRLILLEREFATASVRLEAAEGGFDHRLTDAVRAASTEAFQQSGTQFLDVAKSQMETTVAPLKEALQRSDVQVQKLDQARESAYGALRQQVSVLSERTGSLANALRSPNVRGRWGEAQLRNVVERAGMLEHCDFATQETTRDGAGDLLRPDLIVRIPGGKTVVVDAKVPLAAYLDAFETTDEGERLERLAAHARQVRDHVGKLAAKSYWRQFTPGPDFVVMFVPDETLLRVAHEHEPTITEDAWAQSVILASPSTLMTLLRTVAAIWQQETVAESAREMHDLGRELYGRLGTFAAHLGKVGRSLNSAVGSYNEAVGSFESRVLVQARKLEEHGIDADLDSPEQIERQPRSVAADQPLTGDAAIVELPRDAHAA